MAVLRSRRPDEGGGHDTVIASAAANRSELAAPRRKQSVSCRPSWRQEQDDASGCDLNPAFGLDLQGRVG